MEARTSPFSRTTACPATCAVPEVGRSRVVSIRTSVVFPAPFGPRRPYVSPGRTSNVTALSAIVSPNFRVSFSAWIGLTVMGTKVPAPGARRKGGSPRSMRARLDHESLAGDDRQTFRSEPDGKSPEIAALETPVTPGRELRSRADGDDPRAGAGVRARLRPDLHALSEGKRREAFFGHFDAQPRSLELQRDDGLARRDPLAHPVMARQDHAGRVSHESAFLFEVLHFSEARLERILLGADLTLFRFARADGGGGPVAAMLHALQVRGRSDSLAHQPRHSFFLARDLRELRLETRDV